ncbi:hypothetical protein BQ9231_00045 [Cedratvirus lausannensis]|uniref:F-box domain-containing protein n=1 Tax=Cedratvirus lausannensis TaxID=2023205 RepID=A0A285PWA4_9VIRU|nr:hypothetical protein BQ9231_00045 [Cedratvirus lausannensis]
MREIFLECNIKTLCRLYRTCSSFYLLLKDESFWKTKAKKENMLTNLDPPLNIRIFYCFSRANDLVYKPKRISRYATDAVFYSTDVTHLERLSFIKLDKETTTWPELKQELLQLAREKKAELLSRLLLVTVGSVITLHISTRLTTKTPSFDFGTEGYYFKHVYREVDKEEAFRVLYLLFIREAQG